MKISTLRPSRLNPGVTPKSAVIPTLRRPPMHLAIDERGPKHLQGCWIHCARAASLCYHYSYGPLPVINPYNPIYRIYNPIYNQL